MHMYYEPVQFLIIMEDTTNYFTFGEQTDVHLTYGEVHGSGMAAVRRYHFLIHKYPILKRLKQLKDV